MKEDETEIDLIEKYHKGLLSQEELQQFFEREKSDKDFSAKVHSYKEIMEGIYYYGKQKSIADSIQDWEHEIKQSETNSHTPANSADQNETRVVPLQPRQWYLAAAAIAGLVIISVVLLRPSSDTLALYDNNFQVYPNVVNPTIRGENTDESPMKKAFLAYDEKDYSAAAEHFEESLSTVTGTEKDEALLYLGNCYLALDAVSEAKDKLEQIDQSSNVANEANWYLALAYLKDHDTALARQTLSKLVDHPNSYNERAGKLLRRIK